MLFSSSLSLFIGWQRMFAIIGSVHSKIQMDLLHHMWHLTVGTGSWQSSGKPSDN
jgi:hypothetical protein